MSSWLKGKVEPSSEVASLRFRLAKMEGFDGDYNDFLNLADNVTFERPDPNINWHNVYLLRHGLGIAIKPKDVDIADKVLWGYYSKSTEFHRKCFLELYKIEASEVDYIDQLPIGYKRSQSFIVGNQLMGYRTELLEILQSLYAELGDFTLWSLVLVEMAYTYTIALKGRNDCDLIYVFYASNYPLEASSYPLH